MKAMRRNGVGLVAALALSLLAFTSQRGEAKCDPPGPTPRTSPLRAAVAVNCIAPGPPITARS